MPVKNIVVATDFSEPAKRAFEYAFGLARELRARLHVLHVQDESSLRVAVKEGLLREDSTDEQLCDAVDHLIKQRLAELVGGIDRSDVEIVTATRRGDARAVAVAYAVEVHADLVAVGRMGAGFIEDIRSAVMGSVAEALIRRSPCPVLVVRRDHSQQR